MDAYRPVALPSLFMGLFFLTLPVRALADQDVSAPALALAGISFEISLQNQSPGLPCALRVRRQGSVVHAQSGLTGPQGAGRFQVTLPATGEFDYQILAGERTVARGRLRALPAWLSLLPPLVAVALALLLRQVILALVAGVALGAWIVHDWNPLTALLRLLDTYIVGSYADRDHVIIIVFSLLLGGMVGIISRSGGIGGLVDLLSRRARSSTGAQLATWGMGLVVFFDDYANTLFASAATRPLADRFRVSREKLSYLVDCTAAPVANLALISTWIGFEVSLIGDALAQQGVGLEPYWVFLASLPYRFYPILAIALALWVILLRRDFGPMRRAERRARQTGRVLADRAVPLANYEARELMPAEGVPPRWQMAALPISAAILGILGGLWWTGLNSVRAEGGDLPAGLALLRAVLSHADSYASLLWGSALGCLVAGGLARGYRALDLQGTVEAWIAGMRAMFLAVVILGLAWSIGQVCQDLHTASYLVDFLGPHLAPAWLPALTTLVCAGISFATGSSWATMSIVMPLVIPLAYAVTGGLGEARQTFFLITTVSSVLAGATFGDHCSPISDTTILSSLFTGADHLDHVKTQLPYALAAGAVAWLIGDVATARGLPAWGALVAGVGLLGLIVWRVGKPVTEYDGGGVEG